jgi:hypothetical protein
MVYVRALVIAATFDDRPELFRVSLHYHGRYHRNNFDPFQYNASHKCAGLCDMSGDAQSVPSFLEVSKTVVGQEKRPIVVARFT